jgi:hypothetical protein
MSALRGEHVAKSDLLRRDDEGTSAFVCHLKLQSNPTRTLDELRAWDIAMKCDIADIPAPTIIRGTSTGSADCKAAGYEAA